MSSVDNSCSICQQSFDKQGKNLAVFDCGHKFHLSCVLKNTKLYTANCPLCTRVQKLNLKPNLGDDRKIAMAASVQARIKRRQITPKPEESWFVKLLHFISPFKSEPTTITEYIAAGYRLPDLQKQGFTPDDCVHDKMTWDFLSSKASINHILQFGIKWKEMVSMGIKSNNLKQFTWSQIKHTLNLSANEMLKLNMTLQELADLEYTPHQLNDLGFTWETFVALGASVDNMQCFKMSVEDIKTYFNPSPQQWNQAGFYDKNRLNKCGWSTEDVIRLLPKQHDRSGGRQLRLTF